MGAGFAAAGIGMTSEVAAQILGTTGRDGGGSAPLRKPACFLDHLDRNEYIHNMEILSFVKGRGGVGNDSVGPVMWARGAQRVLPNMAIDISDPKKPVVMGEPTTPFGGPIGGPLGYVTRLKKWVAIQQSGRQGWTPTPEYPQGQYHMAYRRKKWMFADDYSSWTGCHGGMVMPQRPEDGGTIGYCGMGAFGMYVMDVTDITNPKPIGRLDTPVFTRGAIPWHTQHPVVADSSHPRLQDLLICTYEPLESDCQEAARATYVVDVKDKRNPKIIGLFQPPKPDPTAPYTDFCCARGRVGPHIIQAWAAPGVNQPHLLAITYYNAGLRIFDISEPTEPKEVAYFVPARRGDINKWNTFRRQDGGVFVEWDRNLIWFSSNYIGEEEGGLYCMSCPALGKPILEPRKVTRWTVPHINVGWDDQTPRTVYLGRSLRQMS
jgi:hypothetical protein